MTDLSRELIIRADGQPIDHDHACLSGHESIGLFPYPFTLQLWNLAEEPYLQLSRSREVSVEHDGSVLATGKIADVYREAEGKEMLTTVSFSPGLDLWEKIVSLSVEAGVTVSETVQRILTESRRGISLLSFSGYDPLFSRGQAFFGRAAECISDVLAYASARGYLTPSGLCMIPQEGPPVSMTLTEEDLLSEPSFPSSGLMVLRTRVIGWMLGKKISVTWMGLTVEGIVTERSVNADNMKGAWQAELLVEL